MTNTAEQEEAVVSTCVVNAVLGACNLATLPCAEFGLDLPGDAYYYASTPLANAAWGPAVPLGHTRLVFPGSFNPLHVGHTSMAQVALCLAAPLAAACMPAAHFSLCMGPSVHSGDTLVQNLAPHRLPGCSCRLFLCGC